MSLKKIKRFLPFTKQEIELDYDQFCDQAKDVSLTFSHENTQIFIVKVCLCKIIGFIHVVL